MLEKNYLRGRVFALLVFASWMPGATVISAPEDPSPIGGPDQASAEQAGGASYSISWYTVESGGTNSSDGTFAITGTAGQADTGLSSDETFTVEGGFRSRSSAQSLFQDGFESGDFSRWSAAVGN
jgi:hypothetical protein